MAFNNFYTQSEDLHFHQSSNYEPYPFNTFQDPIDSSYSTSHYTHPSEVIPSPQSYDPFYYEPIFDSTAVHRELLYYEEFQSTNGYIFPGYYEALNSSSVTIPNFRVSYSESVPSDTKIVTLFEKTPESHRVLTRVHPPNDDDFNELDPTPYGGGYDIVSTYGKPLLVSDATCYPRPRRGNATPDAPKRVSFVLPASPIKEVNRAPSLPTVEDKREDKPKEVEKAAPMLTIGDGGGEDKPKEVGEREAAAGFDPWKYGMEIAETGNIPYGNGLESVDICETIFGPWPCLNPNLRHGCRCCGYRRGYYGGRDGNPWSRAADYLFGDPNPYSSNYGNSYRDM